MSENINNEFPTKKALTSIIESLKNQKLLEVNDERRSQENTVILGQPVIDSSCSTLNLGTDFACGLETSVMKNISCFKDEKVFKTETEEELSKNEVRVVSNVGDSLLIGKSPTTSYSINANGNEKQQIFIAGGSLGTFDKLNQVGTDLHKYGTSSQICETTASAEPIDISSRIQDSLKARKRRMDRSIVSNSTSNPDYSMINNNSISNNNNNNVKNERLSPSTPDTSSRSRSVTPSSASHPGTPPASDTPMLPGSRNYSDFMRSLAAKYNNSNPNDYFSAARNGFAPPLDPRFKPASFPVMPNITPPANNKENDLNSRKPDFSSILNPFASTPLFPPLMDMSSTQALLAMVRTAKETELQSLLKNAKRPEPASPLDLSAAAPPLKKPKLKQPSWSGSSGGMIIPNRAKSESPNLGEDIKNWTVDDVCNFVSSIDICAEYAQNFRDQRIDGSGLPLLTEEHLTSTMSMKLGPALKLKSILAKKLGSCNICLHCTHCHNNPASPEPATTTGNSSDSGGATS